MKHLVTIAGLLGGLALPAAAHALEVESGVRPEQRERVRVSLTLRNPRFEASLLRTTRPTFTEGDEGAFAFPTISEVCDLPCTVRATRMEILSVQGDRWSQPVRLQRFRGSDIDLVVRPGRPGRQLAGMILSSIGIAVTSLGSSLWISGVASGGFDDAAGPNDLAQAGRGLTLGGLGGLTLGFGMMIQGSSGIRQRNRRGQPPRR